MKYCFLPILTAVLCGLSVLLLLRDIRDHEDLYRIDAEKKKSFSIKLAVFSSVMIVITLGISVLYCTVYKDFTIWNAVKNLVLLSALWPIAYTDYHTYRIPNAFIIAGICYRLAVLPFELFLNSDYVWIILLSEVISAGALLLASVLCAVCIKNSIGFGDMKLFIVMGLLLGLDEIWSAIFLSLVISFFISIYLLVTKKKTRKDAIPFGPALVIGTYLSVGLSNI